MRTRTGLCTVTLWLATAASVAAAGDARATEAPSSGLIDVCSGPLASEDALLDQSLDNYLPTATRDVATAAAANMAATLRDAHGRHATAHLHRALETHARSIASLASKRPPARPTTAEISALKRVRTALYADTAVALLAIAKTTPPEELPAVYGTRLPLLNSVLESLSARQQMRAAERAAICDVLDAFEGDLLRH